MGGDSAKKSSVSGSNNLLPGSALADRVTPNHSLCPSMSLKTRVYGWVTLMCVGCLVSLVSCGMITSLIKGGDGIIKFGVIYTLGTICSLGSSMFLWGPARQCKAMFDKTRRIVTIIFLSCIMGVITCLILLAFDISSGFPYVSVMIALVITQYCAYFWYSLSFIPFGRTIFCKCLKKQVGD